MPPVLRQFVARGRETPCMTNSYSFLNSSINRKLQWAIELVDVGFSNVESFDDHLELYRPYYDYL